MQVFIIMSGSGLIRYSSDEDEFNSRLVDDLIDNLNGPISLSLSHTEKSMLATVAQATLEVSYRVPTVYAIQLKPSGRAPTTISGRLRASLPDLYPNVRQSESKSRSEWYRYTSIVRSCYTRWTPFATLSSVLPEHRLGNT